ncbi:MAG: 30S ribosomal protein S2 [Pyrinomonadaceae bacterium]|nr:30S ribosomal protein S2 [Pyrinomonadaceae bacterium]
MATVTMKELLEAGVHFGHQVRRWNPKMKEFIFGERNGIYIIDLQKTQKLFRDALAYVQNTLTEKPSTKVLFVGTKRQAQDAIIEEATRCNQYYINNRWLGGLMTNYKTVQRSIKRLKEIEEMKEDGRAEMLTKKERLQLDRELGKLMKNLSGIKDMGGLPDMLFVIDVRKEDIAIKEANRLGIPVVAVVDTNCSPEGVDYIIPGNDDALRAIRLFTSRVADSILEGQNVANEGMTQEEEEGEAAEGAAEAPPVDEKATEKADDKAAAETAAAETKKEVEKPTSPEEKTASPEKEKVEAEVKTEAKAAAPEKVPAPEKAEIAAEKAKPEEKAEAKEPEAKTEEKPEEAKDGAKKETEASAS